MNKIVKLWFKNIKNSLSQFLSVTIIVLLGVGFLSGLLASTPNMKENLDKFLKDNNTWDIKVISPLGFADKDLNKIKEIDGVSQIGFSKETDLWSENTNGEKVETRVFFSDIASFSSEKKLFNFNKLRLLEGRIAKSNDECVVEIANIYNSKKNIGDTITIKGKKEKSYKIVGKVRSSNFISAHGDVTGLGNGKIFLGVYLNSKEEESLSKSEGLAVKTIRKKFDLSENKVLLIRIDKNKLSIFSEEYKNKIEDIGKKIEKIGQGERDKIKNLAGNVNISWNLQNYIDTAGFSNFKTDVEKIASIAKVFPVFFFFVAFLVVTTTMTRMIDDHRKEMGILRAIGYSKTSLRVFYIAYGVFAGLIGTLVGVPGGFIIFPKFITKAYSTVYNLPKGKILMFYDIGGIIIGISVVVIGFTVMLVVRKELKEVTSALLLPKSPEAGKRIFLERINFIWKRIKFSKKVTFRNIFRYKKRFVMTVVGVSGCMALLIGAFGLKDSISNVANIQFNEISKYNILVLTEPGAWERQNNKDYDGIALYSNETTVLNKTRNKVDTGDNKLTLNVIGENSHISEYMNFRDKDTKKKLEITDRGILLSEKIADIFQIKKDDYVKIDLDGKSQAFKVDGTFENYTGHQGFLSSKYYKEVTGKTVENNRVFIKDNDKKTSYKGRDEEKRRKVIEKIKEIKGVNLVMHLDDVRDTFEKSIKNIDGIIGVLSVCAGLLTFVILYNLSNINLIERKNELSTIKVLGFYKKEVRGYIFREINIISGIGVILGIPLGILLHRFIISRVESGGVMFTKIISYSTYFYGALIIGTFVLLTNLAMARKINKVDMLESMKAND